MTVGRLLRNLVLAGTPVIGAAGHAAAPSLTLDLAAPGSANVTRIYGRGPENGGAAGVPVSGGRDCDGDGHPEIAFAQFLSSPFGRFLAGEVSVVFGDGTIGYTADAAVRQADILLIAGEQDFENTGSEVWIDDVTGDGLGDLLIGRQNHTLDRPLPAADRPGAGALTILVGDPGWRTHAATLAHLDLAAPPAGLKLITFVGPGSYDRLGIWMRTGDITGDGIADVVVGADEVDADGAPVSQNQGAAFVIRGGPHLLEAPAIVDLADFGQAAFPDALKGHVAWIDPPPGSSDDHFGGTVQVGDLDGNRRAEVIVAATINRAGASYNLPGAPGGTGEHRGGSTDGTVFIVWDENFPPGMWPEDHRFAASDPPLGDATVIDGDASAQSFGEEIIAGLDFSGDGFPDLMVGDLVADPFGRFDAGRGYIFYNAGNLRGLDFDAGSPPAGVNITNIYGPLSGAISSDSVLHGDFNGDGIGDLGVGNPHDSFFGRTEAGSIHVLYGQAGGWPAAVDLNANFLPGPALMRIALVRGARGRSGDDSGDTLCYSAAAGDINSDGRPDLVVNEMAGNGSPVSPDDVGNMIVIDAASLLGAFEAPLDVSPPGPVDFGSVDVAAGAAVRNVTLTNQGSGAVQITNVFLAGPRAADYSITADSGETTLAAGASRVVTVTFDPQLVARSGAALRVYTNADPHPVGVGLRGRGVDGSLVAPEIDIYLLGSDAVVELPSQFGTNYTLARDADPSGWQPLFTVPGNGQRLFLTDRMATELRAGAIYRVAAGRE
ncbi:MAG: choice-of-anchor D domain-containing protein [Akkermansiaceae bacterium]|nr:choice-of-anchor D domain-containing protein [Akkermansiaceae bacterium]